MAITGNYPARKAWDFRTKDLHVIGAAWTEAALRHRPIKAPVKQLFETIRFSDCLGL
jgi:hypothetical protein